MQLRLFSESVYAVTAKTRRAAELLPPEATHRAARRRIASRRVAQPGAAQTDECPPARFAFGCPPRPVPRRA